MQHDRKESLTFIHHRTFYSKKVVGTCPLKELFFYYYFSLHIRSSINQVINGKIGETCNAFSSQELGKTRAFIEKKK